jgi:tubulin--tyrosine ligase
VYLSRDCLALCSGTRYRKNDTANLFAHITNTAYQDKDPNFQEDKCVLLWDDKDIPPILVKDKVCRDLTKASQQIQKVMDDMVAITAELFRAYQSEFGVFYPIDGCFEHYGLDFMVDDQWQVYLLEVNPGPDFKQTGSRLQSAIENLMGSTIDIVFHDKLSPRASMPTVALGNMQLCYERDASKNSGSRA